ncbi:adenylate/guanylate cyclase domain-containing protein [Gillisia hiemivivida]|uniref:Adenylate cyclase n=1 Tax=Gillisia hiemivivida TaxID=291190 RepID=A0A5C6ZS06_9FLAO|nr:adenylate/guanylate cyclase domain-containing protein [Gillisia hiemivivida]TXD92758.1 tetratricopeptide repeat protein [Gillisia hiemivivida]
MLLLRILNVLLNAKEAINLLETIYLLKMRRQHYFLVLTTVLFCYWHSFAQNPELSDSLKSVYYSNSENQTDLEMLSNIADNEVDPDSVTKYSLLLITNAKALGDDEMIYSGYHQLGNGLRLQGDFKEALKAYFKSLNYANKIRDNKAIAYTNIEIGNVYSLSGNTANADLYYNKGIDELRKGKDSIPLGSALFNAGDEYLRLGNLEKAEIFTKEAELIFEKADYPLGRAYSLGNLGRINAGLGNDDLAEENLNTAIVLLQELNAHNAIAEFLVSLSNVYSEKGDTEKAFEYARRSLEISKKYGFKNYIAAAYAKLSELYEEIGYTAKSFQYYKDFITYRDSVRNLESISEMANLRTNFEISQKQTEVDLLSQQKKNQQNIVIGVLVALFLLMLLVFGLYRRNNFIRRTNLIIEKEKNRSERLLRNILPEGTALELMETGKVKAKKFKEVSVLFTDFEGFTQYAESLSPEELVKSVDFYFTKFDKIIEKHGLEKIKTIGDSYMCAAGVPFPIKDHAIKIMYAALEILDFVEKSKRDHQGLDAQFEIRIGINSGSLIAGVVGSKKFAYDIWGDTVNMASRMESCSESGKINISENTYQLVKGDFSCIERGKIEVKNKGMVPMYFVECVKDLSTKSTNGIPTAMS